MANQLETRLIGEMADVALRPGEEVVEAEHLVSLAEEVIAQMRPQEARASRYQNALVLAVPHLRRDLASVDCRDSVLSRWDCGRRAVGPGSTRRSSVAGMQGSPGGVRSPRSGPQGASCQPSADSRAAMRPKDHAEHSAGPFDPGARQLDIGGRDAPLPGLTSRSSDSASPTPLRAEAAGRRSGVEGGSLP